jgi:hypothetical protein
MNLCATDIAGSHEKYYPLNNYFISNSYRVRLFLRLIIKRMDQRVLTLPFVPLTDWSMILDFNIHST